MLNTQSFWDEPYNNEEVGWDMKSPTPVIKSYLKEQKFPISIKILIMGSGYDAIEAAKTGLEVTAVDFSPAAIKIAKKSTDEKNVTVIFWFRTFSHLLKSFAIIFIWLMIMLFIAPSIL
jgi:hypothetical protein